MSEVRRKLVRFLILLLPALLLLAAVYAIRGDLREAAARPRKTRYTHENNSFDTSKRRDELGPWTAKFIKKLSDLVGLYGFRNPPRGFSIEVRREQGSTRYERGSTDLVIWSEDAHPDTIKRELSRLITRAMLWEGGPDAEYSPWFEEGVSSFYESTDAEAVGSKKDRLINRASRNPTSLSSLLTAGPKTPNLDALGHSIVAYLHENYSPEKIAQYASEERKPGPVSSGAFERIFGPDFEKAWREDLRSR